MGEDSSSRLAKGEDSSSRLAKVLWQGKFYILMALALAVMMAVAAYYIYEARSLSYRLDQKDSDYNALNDEYNKLSYDHSSLVASNDDLNRRYEDLNDKYNDLTGDNQDLKASYTALNASYNDLSGKVSRMHETGGPVFAMRYNFYEGGPTNDRKNYLEAWIYNVGNAREDRVTVKARIMNADNTTSISEQTFNDVDALDKRYVKWEYSTSTRLESVWWET